METQPLSPIAGRYRVEAHQPVDGAGGGLPAFAVTNLEHGREKLIAIQMLRRLPARAGAIAALGRPIDHLMHPVAHGAAPGPDGHVENFILCPAPPGPSLARAPHTWSEAALLDLLLRPAAQVLHALHDIGLTHRAIRPDNVFAAAPGQKITLGCAWASPPASLQPALFEPPGVAMCVASGRGEGCFADDIYALGALMVTLAAGASPLAGLDDATIIRRKLELGSYAALLGDHRLPPALADLARGMLAEDPEHRPGAALLMDPVAARTRRVAARPARRAQRRFRFGDPPPADDIARIHDPNAGTISDARQLAYELATHPLPGLAALRDGSVGSWLRRGLGDSGLAARIDEAMRPQGGDAEDTQTASLALLRVVAVLDPLAPVAWEGIAILPDGIGPALAAALDIDRTTIGKLERLIAAEAISAWGQAREDRCDAGLLRIAARQLRAVQRQRGAGGAGLNDDAARLAYRLNPMLPCASPLVAGHLVLRLADLLPALNANRSGFAASRPIDAHVCAFVAARAERRLDSDLAAITATDADAEGALAQLSLLAHIQAIFSPQPQPGLALWLVERSLALGQLWRRRDRQAQFAVQIRALAEIGLFGPMLALVEDPTSRAADRNEARQAEAALRRIDADLAQLRTGSQERAMFSVQLGQEVAAGIGLALLAAVLTVQALS